MPLSLSHDISQEFFISQSVIFIVADDPAVRDSLRSPLVREGFDVRAYDSPKAFLDAIVPSATGCVLIDIDMPDGAGFGLMAEIHRRHLALPFIVTTGHANPVFCAPEKKALANSCLKRPFEEQTVLAIVRHVLNRAHDHNPESRAIRMRFASLSKRDSDVLAGLLRGRSSKAIAHELGISRKTVEGHRANLKAKTGARSLVELLRMSLAAEKSLAPPEGAVGAQSVSGGAHENQRAS
jgi:two-component system, LuxR family, response regulator FixJ